MFGAISLLLLISFILNLIIVASIFYIAGRIIIGRKNVSFRDFGSAQLVDKLRGKGLSLLWDCHSGFRLEGFQNYHEKKIQYT